MSNEIEKEEKFAEGFCFYKLFLIFIIGCIFGAIYEELILNFFRFLINGSFHIEPRRGLLYGPFSPVYGFGAVIMSLFVKEKRSPFKTFLYTALAGGIVEYLVSFLQETFTHYGEFLDKHYNDERMKKTYNNMIFK